MKVLDKAELGVMRDFLLEMGLEMSQIKRMNSALEPGAIVFTASRVRALGTAIQSHGRLPLHRGLETYELTDLGFTLWTELRRAWQPSWPSWDYRTEDQLLRWNGEG